MDERKAHVALAAAEVAWTPTLAATLEAVGGAAALLRRARPAEPRSLAKARAVDATSVLARAADLGQHVLTPLDGAWPATWFAALDARPFALFVRGRPPPPQPFPIVGIVGTRAASPLGLELAGEMARHLALAGCATVSGLALGIDGAAHAGALDVVDGPATWAVLGSGLDVVYPAEHADLAERIAAVGGLLSEHPPGTRPERWRFPRRNRLVAAFCTHLVVVEAPASSGALSTARLALEQGRDVFAMPGSVRWASSAGCHELLVREEAGLVRHAGDVLAAMNRAIPSEVAAALGLRAQHELPSDPRAARLWRVLDDRDRQSEDALALRCGLPIEEVLAFLVSWERAGKIDRMPGLGTRLR